MNIDGIRGEMKSNYDLAKLAWFKVGGKAQFLFKPADLDDLVYFLKKNQENIPVNILGAGSNIIIRDGGIDGAVVKLTKDFTNIDFYQYPSNSVIHLLDKTIDSDKSIHQSNLNINNTTITDEINDQPCLDKISSLILSSYSISENDVLLEVGAGCLNFNLTRFATENSISGFEFMSAIPGTIGGGIAMNAGSYGREFQDVILAVQAVDKYGNIHLFSTNDIGFSYRKNNLPDNLIYTKAILRGFKSDQAYVKQQIQNMNKSRELTQPVGQKTGGSTFANPNITFKEALDKSLINQEFIQNFLKPGEHPQTTKIKAWQLIDYAGCRGKILGGAIISPKHCNFMINQGNATAQNLEDLGFFVQKVVEEKTGIKLHWEIKIIGNKLPRQ